MKTLSLRLYRLTFTLISLFTSLALWAQETNSESSSSSTTTKTSVSINSTGGNTWYMQPWVWVIGGAVFILLLVALLSGNRNRDTVTRERITVKKTDNV